MLSAQHRLNLRALAKYLDELADPKHFNMSYFYKTAAQMRWPQEFTKQSFEKCDTVACALGHAGFLFPARMGETWVHYGNRIFGLDFTDNAWRWMFDQSWSQIDNTPKGAAKRINIFLDKGLPRDAEKQRLGLAKLCYERWK